MKPSFSILHRIQQKLKRSIVDASFATGIEGFMYSGIKGNRILMYHGVDLSESKKFNLRHVGIENFTSQILWLKKNCNIVSLDEFYNGVFSENKFNVAITFDDGYLNNYKYAIPLLEQLQIPATIFVTGLDSTDYKIAWGDSLNLFQKLYPKDIFKIDGITFHRKNMDFSDSNDIKLSDYLNNSDFRFKDELNKYLFAEVNMNDENLLDYWKLMNKKQIIEVSRSKFISIQSHGYYHNSLGNLDISDALAELTLSKAYLENLTQKEINSLAYPSGNYTSELSKEVVRLGFVQQLLTDEINSDDINSIFLKTRYGIYPAFSWRNQIHEVLHERK